MQETDTALCRGTIRVLGLLHGGVALNTMVTYFDHPHEWEMKQFVSQQELDEFVKAEMLQLINKE